MGWKIVRDRVDEWSREHGVSGIWRPCKEPEASLRKKLFEEAGEYIENLDPGELYDLADVLDRLIRLVDPESVYAARHGAKIRRLGLFENLIEWSPVPEEHEKREL
jgi:predicted house-cleaning noncanonical NTP pyrophosphatase (MazG superfamily)